MAKLFINKDIAADADKMKYWMSGEDCVSFSDIQSFLDWIEPHDNVVDIELHSCGGDCTEGYAIYDALRASGKEISCKVVGQCASMATVILLAAPLERRSMYEHAEVLIHNPYFPSVSEAVTLDKIAAWQKDLTDEKEKMLSIYVERTGKAREELEAQMSVGGWFGKDKAIELGFVSHVVPAMSAKQTKTINNNSKEMKKENVTVSKSIIDRLLAKCGYAKIEDVPAVVAKVITTSTGDELTVEREEGEIQVGDPASPDGEFVLEDGRTVKVEDGVITEITEPSSEEEEDTSALQARINDLEAQVAELQKNAKTEADERILASVKKAGGEKWLAKAAASTYVPAGRAPQGKKEEEEKPLSVIQKRLKEAREKNAAKYKR